MGWYFLYAVAAILLAIVIYSLSQEVFKDMTWRNNLENLHQKRRQPNYGPNHIKQLNQLRIGLWYEIVIENNMEGKFAVNHEPYQDGDEVWWINIRTPDHQLDYLRLEDYGVVPNKNFEYVKNRYLRAL